MLQSTLPGTVAFAQLGLDFKQLDLMYEVVVGFPQPAHKYARNGWPQHDPRI